MRPEISSVLTRSRGSFEEVLENSDLVVEVMGGLDPARDYVLRAMQAGKHVVTANKQLLSHHGEELWGVARENGVQLRFEAAVAGVVPVIRVLQESLAAARSSACTGSSTGRRTTSSPRWPAPARRTPTRWPTRSASATRSPTRPTTSPAGRRGEDGDPRPAGVRHAGAHRPGPARGIEHITADDLAYARDLGSA
jgi:homoserine dehydrogenase